MTDSYIYLITALLPLTASMLVFQTNPYHALVIRGILGAVAALVYTVLGAADVALTEALVGTMLAVTLYAVAVRSSLVMRLGILEDGANQLESDDALKKLIDKLRAIFNKYHLRLELLPYKDIQALERALLEREIHALCAPQSLDKEVAVEECDRPYHTAIGVQRLYEIVTAELPTTESELTYINVAKEEHR